MQANILRIHHGCFYSSEFLMNIGAGRIRIYAISPIHG